MIVIRTYALKLGAYGLLVAAIRSQVPDESFSMILLAAAFLTLDELRLRESEDAK